MAKAEKKETNYLDIDGAIARFKEKYPDVEMSRTILAKELGLNYQSLTNYQGGKIPKSFNDIKMIEDRLECQFNELYKTKK